MIHNCEKFPNVFNLENYFNKMIWLWKMRYHILNGRVQFQKNWRGYWIYCSQNWSSYYTFLHYQESYYLNNKRLILVTHNISPDFFNIYLSMVEIQVHVTPCGNFSLRMLIILYKLIHSFWWFKTWNMTHVCLWFAKNYNRLY